MAASLKDKLKHKQITAVTESEADEIIEKNTPLDEGRLTLRISKQKLEDFKYICKHVYKSDMSKELMRFIDSVIANNQTAASSRKNNS